MSITLNLTPSSYCINSAYYEVYATPKEKELFNRITEIRELPLNKFVNRMDELKQLESELAALQEEHAKEVF